MTTVTITFKEKSKIIEALLNAFKAIAGVKVKVEEEKGAAECKKSHVPNAETRKALENAKSGKDCKTYKNSKEMFKALGINV